MKYNKPEELQKPEVFNDSIYGYIYINYLFLKKLIDTSPMQRLRRIKQLSFVHMVFSCAEQSRFNHSLGVYELARRFLEINNNILINIFDHRTKMLLLTSALLHDIGHGSYSHTFEIIFKTNHEKQSATIILEHKEINNILDKIDLNFKKDVTSIINKEGKFKLIEQLLSSQLDFDRLDYLRRDAFFTGVSYGYIDSDLLIRSMEIDKKTNKIVFKKSSITSIENYLINRYHMYCRVYYHTKVIGFSVILEQIFKRVDFLFKNKYKFQCSDIISILEKFINQPDDIYNYLNIDDFYIHVLIFYLKKEKDNILINLCNDFLNRNIWSYLDINKDNQQKIQEIKNHYKIDEIDYYTYDGKKITSIIYKENKNNIGDNILIYKDFKQQNTTTLSKESPIINLLSRHLQDKNLQKIDSKFFYRKYKNE